MKTTEQKRFQEFFEVQEYFNRFEKAKTAWVNTIKTHGYRAVHQEYGISINTLQRLVKGESLKPSTRNKIIRIYEEIKEQYKNESM